MATLATDAVDRFASYLEASERSPHTVRCYRSDLGTFGRWFEKIHDEPF